MNADPRVAATLIAGDGVSKEECERLFTSLAEVGVSHIFLSLNATKKTPRFEKLSPIPITIARLEWEDDFSVARNHSLSMIDRDEFDWAIWADMDDSIHSDEGETIQSLIASVDPRVRAIFLRYDYGHDELTGEVTVIQWRERIFSLKHSAIWRYPIHENLCFPPFAHFSRQKSIWVKHHRLSTEDKGTRERNRKLLMKALRQYPEDARFQAYFAKELLTDAFNEKDPEKKEQGVETAMVAYDQYLQNDPSPEDKYMALHNMADACRMIGRQQDAVERDLKCIAIIPHWPDAYMGIVNSMMAVGDYKRAEEFATLSLAIADVDIQTTQPIEPLERRYTPLVLRGMAFASQGEYAFALEDFHEAQTIWDPPDLAGIIQEVEDALREQEEELVSGPPAVADFSCSPSAKSIAFFTQPHVEPWHPELEKKYGIGGAETCVMKVAQHFAREGWDTIVYGTPGEHKGPGKDGVYWAESGDFEPSRDFDVVVSSRTPTLFDADMGSSKTILWVHDVHCGHELIPGSGLMGDRLSRIDHIVGLSPWHKRHLEALYGLNGVDVVPNGIDMKNYEREPEPRDGAKFVYASSPDRGLDVLLSMWPFIKQVAPDATLEIFYGWNTVDGIIARAPNSPIADSLKRYKVYMEELFENIGGDESGVIWRGRVPQHELAEKLYEKTHWTHPTFFMETMCITALEMQMAGVIPVTSELAALETTVAVPELKIRGWPNNEDYRARYLTLLEKVLQSPLEQRREWVKTGRTHAEEHSWERIFETKWLPLVTSSVATTTSVEPRMAATTLA